MRHLAISVLIILLASVFPATADEEQWIPAAASSPGAQGTMWTTDLWIASRVIDAPIVVRAAFLPDQSGTADPVEVEIALQPGAQVEISDAVATLFGENRPGAIRLRSEHPFIAQSRTANDGGDAGSFGQGIPAFTSDEAEEAGTFVGASNQPGPDGHRTNIGIVNIGDETEDVWIAARHGENLEDLGIVTIEIGPHGWYQANLFELLGVEDQSITLAEVTFARPGTELLGYLSRIDNRSGDPTFFAPSHAPAVRVVPTNWQLEATLTYTGGAVIESYEYTDENGDTTTIEDPESGFSTGVLSFVSPTTFCSRVVGFRQANESGSLEISVDKQRAGDPPGSSSHRVMWNDQGNSTEPLNEELCIDLY